MGSSKESKAASKAIAEKEFYCRSCGNYYINALKKFIGARIVCRCCHNKIISRNLEIKARDSQLAKNQ